MSPRTIHRAVVVAALALVAPLLGPGGLALATTPVPAGTPTATAIPEAASTPTPPSTTTPEPTLPADGLTAAADAGPAAVAAAASDLGEARTGPATQPVRCEAGVCGAGFVRLQVAWSQDAGVVLHRSTAPVSTARPLADVRAGDAFLTEIEWLHAVGVANGWPDGTYRPLEEVSRGAVAAFLYRLAGAPSYTAPGTPTFADVPRHHPFFHEIEWLADRRITSGWVENHQRWFRPDASVQREAMAAFLHRFSGSPGGGASEGFSDVVASNPFRAEIAWLASTGVSTGHPDGTFRPYDPVRRDAMAAFLFRLQGLAGLGLPASQGQLAPIPQPPPPPPPPPAPAHRMQQPAGTNGPPTSPFGMRLHPITKKWTLHNGVDLGNTTGQPVVAAADGQVYLRSWTSGGGNSLYLRHGQFGDVTTRYLHLNSYAVANGQWVARGQLIGYMGATGSVTKPHLHFCVTVNGGFVNPEDWIGPISGYHR
ncbi:S-layer homology domain-containing protein [Propioniciclava soli]|uniref:S-layer homology domain-containing protein n=1 Tax=Propioniciclava soli TaxID=2775081 RepID=A0ABZ3CAF1_9ACTN